jgi:hypothetical protein
MYYATVLALMVVFPLLSIAIDSSVHHASPDLFLIGKWLVFWAVGVRLLLAGLRQVVQPQYTAKTILGIEGNGALFAIRELGFANAAIGAVGSTPAVQALREWWRHSQAPRCTRSHSRLIMAALSEAAQTSRPEVKQLLVFGLKRIDH